LGGAAGSFGGALAADTAYEAHTIAYPGI